MVEDKDAVGSRAGGVRFCVQKLDSAAYDVFHFSAYSTNIVL
jgi:hypothetical protein